MKIGSFDNKPAGVERSAPAGAERKADVVKGGASAPASAQVELSPTAAALAGGAVDAGFDQAKVERIAQAIRDGSYRINAEAIADKLIANAQDLLGKADS
jgi:negative regulator of flagellin synthesis FlgM